MPWHTSTRPCRHENYTVDVVELKSYSGEVEYGRQIIDCDDCGNSSDVCEWE